MNLALNNMEKLALNSKFHESLECPICYDYYIPPILLCPNGHSICSLCGAKSKVCPICRGQLSRNSRNIVLENILEQITQPCKFEGCDVETTLANRLAHFAVCAFNKLLRCIECNNQQDDLLAHLVHRTGTKRS